MVRPTEAILKYLRKKWMFFFSSVLFLESSQCCSYSIAFLTLFSCSSKRFSAFLLYAIVCDNLHVPERIVVSNGITFTIIQMMHADTIDNELHILHGFYAYKCYTNEDYVQSRWNVQYIYLFPARNPGRDRELLKISRFECKIFLFYGNQ